MVKVDNADKVLPPIQLPASCQLQNGRILKSDHPSLAELDLDGDGDIDMEDLHKLVHLKRSQETLIKTQKITVLVLSCIIIGVGVGLAVELKAARSAIEGARVGRTVPHVEVPLALQVPSGTAGTEESEHDTAVSVDLTDKDGHAIRTDRSYDKLLLTSELPDAAFDQLEQLKIEGPDGSVNFKTTGFARYNSEDSRCGSVVVVFTAVGFVQFDGAGMTFSETVVGAFQRAGFVVSANRKRRRSVGRSGRSVDESIHTLVGVSKIFGEFRFLQNLDLSALSCGDEVPSMKVPFDGDHTDLQAEEEKLIMCGENLEGYSPCPANGDVTTDSHGRTYYKRVTQIRAKKVDGVWRSIRSTSIPELDNNREIADELRGGKMVEITVANRGTTYQFFPKSSSSQFVRCTGEGAAVDFTGSYEANTDDETAGETYLTTFIGYDVFNGHYVKHFRIFYQGAPGDGVDYYESYDEKRPYSLGLLAPAVYTTYESIKTDDDVEPGFLQGEGYPSLDEPNSTSYFDAISCTDDTELAKLVTPGVTPNQQLALEQELQRAAMPNLRDYMSFPFVPAEFEHTMAESSEQARALIDAVFADEQVVEGNRTGGRERRLTLSTGADTCDSPGHASKTKKLGDFIFEAGTKWCKYKPMAQVYAKMSGSYGWNGFTVSAGGEVSVTAKAESSTFDASGTAWIQVEGKGLPVIKLTLTASYQPGAKGYSGWMKKKHVISITGEMSISNCENKRAARQFSVGGGGAVNYVGTTIRNIKHFDETIPGGIIPKCPAGQHSVGVGMANTYEGWTFNQARMLCPYTPTSKVITVVGMVFGTVFSHDIPLK